MIGHGKKPTICRIRRRAQIRRGGQPNLDMPLLWGSGRAARSRATAQALRSLRQRSLRACGAGGALIMGRHAMDAHKARTLPRPKLARNVKKTNRLLTQTELEVNAVKGSGPRAIPAVIEPQLATLTDEVPEGQDWYFETKYDGYRMLARIEGAKVSIFSRNGKDWTNAFAHLVKALKQLPIKNAWLDGEVVVLNREGVSSFQALQNSLSEVDTSAMQYYLFDIPYINDSDLRGASLKDRKIILARILKDHSPPLHFSGHVVGQGKEAFRQACIHGLEGIIAKDAASTYAPKRSQSWLKLKCTKRQELVIGGYTDPEGSRTGFGALLLGVYEKDGKLRYCGKVGTGFNDKVLISLKKRMDNLLQDKPTFSNPPKGSDARRCHWLKPELIAEIEFTEWTRDGTLRHPSFQGLREDKDAKVVVKEEAIHAPKRAGAKPKKVVAENATQFTDNIAGIKLTHPDKMLYPDSDMTKSDLAQYYEAVQEYIVPHLTGRPLTLYRCPNGWQKACFFQKAADPSARAVLKPVTVETSEGKQEYMTADSLAAIIKLVQMSVMEIHPWGSTRKVLERPDRLIFDLDPDDAVKWPKIVEAAGLLRTILEELELKCFLKTTGGKGLHIVVPIRPTVTWDEAKSFTKSVAELLARTFPDRFLATMSKAQRKNKIFIDYLRNAEGATAIGTYCARARFGAPVSTPITWDELNTEVRHEYFNIKNVPERLQRKDPWKDFFEVKQSLTKAMIKRIAENNK